MSSAGWRSWGLRLEQCPLPQAGMARGAVKAEIRGQVCKRPRSGSPQISLKCPSKGFDFCDFVNFGNDLSNMLNIC